MLFMFYLSYYINQETEINKKFKAKIIKYLNLVKALSYFSVSQRALTDRRIKVLNLNR